MNPKYLTILVVAVVEGSILLGLVYFNLYIFGGIDFPNESFATAYWISWWVVVYGGAILVLGAAILLVKKINIGYPWLIGILCLPLMAQIIAIVLYSVLGERYGYVCC